MMKITGLCGEKLAIDDDSIVCIRGQNGIRGLKTFDRQYLINALCGNCVFKKIKGVCGHEIKVVNSRNIVCDKVCCGASGIFSIESAVEYLCDGCEYAPINKPKAETGTVDLQKRVKRLEETLTEAQKDIAAMLFSSGECQYCKHCVPKSVYDATKYSCKLGKGVDCRPEWRGAKHG